MLAAQGAEVTRAATPEEAVGAIAENLRGHGLPSRLRMGADAQLAALPWGSAPEVELVLGPADGADRAALSRAVAKLKLEDSDALMIDIARKRIRDEEVMEALMPGSAGSDIAPRAIAQRRAISIKGLTPGVAYSLASCCHPIPGDRIVGLRREDESIEVHVIGCDQLATGVDADWLDLAWGDESEGGTARLSVILRKTAVPSGCLSPAGEGIRTGAEAIRLAARCGLLSESGGTYVGGPELTRGLDRLRSTFAMGGGDPP